MALIWNPADAQQRRDAAQAAEARLLREAGGASRAERLAAWREFAARQLIARFPMPEDPAARSKLVGQCTAQLEVIAKQLLDRGWLLDGELLARVVIDCLKPIAEQVRAGGVKDFYPYFKAAVARYVPVNAEQIQAAARRGGCDATRAMAEVLAGVIGRIKAPSLVEVIADRPQQPCKPAARGPGRPRKVTGEGTLELGI